MPNIEEIKKMPSKSVIVGPGLVALCAEVMERKTGNGQYGDWSLQPLGLKDDTGEIKAIIWNQPDLAALKGKNVILAAIQGDKGWSGCMVEDNVFNSKTYKQIKASGTFLLEEYKPSQQPANTNGNETHHEPVSRAPSALPSWDEYSAVVRAAHDLALALEPDVAAAEGGFVPDRARARAALVATVLIAYGKKDFKFELGPVPF